MIIPFASRRPRFMVIALAISSSLSLLATPAIAQSGTALNPEGTSSANGGLLALDSGTSASVTAQTNASNTVSDNLRAQARANAQVRDNTRVDTTTRVGDSLTSGKGLLSVDSNGNRNAGVGSTSDVNRSFNTNGLYNTTGSVAGGINNTTGAGANASVNNTTGTGINATVGADTAGAAGVSR